MLEPDFTNIAPVHFSDVLDSFARAETSRFLAEPQLDPAVRALLERIENGSTAPLDAMNARMVILRLRFPMLGFVATNTTERREADYPSPKVGDLKTIRYWYAQRPVPSRTIGELVRNERAAVVLPTFDAARMRGHPIVVGATDSAPPEASEEVSPSSRFHLS